MDALQERRVLWRPVAWIKTQPPVEFLGRVPYFVGHGIPRPTSRVAKPLRLRQITLASPQFPLRIFSLYTLGNQCVIGSLEFLDRFFHRIPCVPEGLRGFPLRGGHQRDK